MLRHLLFLLSALAVQAAASNSTRLYGPQYLLAGQSLSGSTDGNFLKARFKEPAGLAVLGPIGKKCVYVLDKQANTLRKVEWQDGETVSTTLGNGLAGKSLDPHSSCLNAPESLQALSNSKLLIEDRGNQRWLVFDTKSAKLFVLKQLSPDAKTFTRPWVDSTKRKIYFGICKEKTLHSMNEDGSGLVQLASSQQELPALSWIIPYGTRLLMFDETSGKISQFQATPSAPAPVALAPSSSTAQASPVPASLPTGPDFVAIKDTWSPGTRPVFAPSSGEPMKFFTWDPVYCHLGILSGETPTVGALALMDIDAAILSRVPGQRDRCMVDGRAWTAWDEESETLFISDSKAMRVLALRPHYSATDDVLYVNKSNLQDLEYPFQPSAGVKRIMLISDSLGFQTGTHRYGMHMALTKQIEMELNYLAYRHHSRKHYEVMVGGTGLNDLNGGLMGRLVDLKPSAKELGVSEVLLYYPPHMFLWESFAYARTKVGPDGLPSGLLDTEQMLAWRPPSVTKTAVTENDLAYYEPYGFIAGRLPHGAGDILDNKKLMKAMRPFYEKAWMALGAWARQQGIKITIVKTLDRNSFGAPEMSTPNFYSSDGLVEDHYTELLKPLAEKAGLGWMDLNDSMREIEPVIYPLFQDNDHHFDNRACRWMGRMMAEWLWDQSPQPAAEAKP
jgi:hypothetical protein